MNSGLDKLANDIDRLNGVGTKTTALLNKLGIHRIQDLLFHLPLRYQDRTRLIPIGALLPGQEYLVQGEIELSQIKFGRRRSLLCQITDGTGSLVLRFFYFSRAQQDRLQRGQSIRCYGMVRQSGKHPEIIHPEYQFISDTFPTAVDETLTAIYPATEGLHQIKLRKLMDQALNILNHSSDKIELIPQAINDQYQLGDLISSLNYVHRPPPDATLKDLISGTHPAQQRLAFEELLSQYLCLQRLRKRFRDKKSFVLENTHGVIEQFYRTLSFTLTAAQLKVIEEIKHDLAQNIPMLRLLQGDVGSGKTIVAAAAAICAIQSGYQVAMMAPTELLAEQHYENFEQWFSPLGIKPIKLTGKLKKSDYNIALDEIKQSDPKLIIGTHALFQKDVVFGKLGLVIIDEQHRFGVDQRFSLLSKTTKPNHYPHQLVMTATPIPRTLTMTAYADLDISVIDELPPNRKPVNTVIMSNLKRDDLIDRIRAAGHEGRQIYWVCAMIDESETLQCEAAVETRDHLQEMLTNFSVGLIHGKMKNDEKDSVMQAFKDNNIDLLVATTVIEVGVNVPNASLMVIENAERMGLAQLHQLRGRVGRGTKQSDCILLYQGPLSNLASKRLDAIRATNDGFKIAETDLKLRGPGELLGTRQAGLPELSVADLSRDAHLLPQVQSAAIEIASSHPEQVEKLIRRWCGNQADYGQV